MNRQYKEVITSPKDVSDIYQPVVPGFDPYASQKSKNPIYFRKLKNHYQQMKKNLELSIISQNKKHDITNSILEHCHNQRTKERQKYMDIQNKAELVIKRENKKELKRVRTIKEKERLSLGFKKNKVQVTALDEEKQ